MTTEKPLAQRNKEEYEAYLKYRRGETLSQVDSAETVSKDSEGGERDDATPVVELTGTLDAAKRAEFSRRAAQTLTEEARRRDEDAHGEPPPEQFEALELIAERAGELASQFHHVMRHPGSAQSLRDAWEHIERQRGTHRPFPDDDLIETLQCLAFAATIWRPDSKPAHRPVSNSPAASAVTMLALDFWVVFGEFPTTGNGSPFVRYCRKAFPVAGFVCPSRDKIAAIVAQFRR